MQRGTTHYVARQHTVSQVRGGEVMSVNEILMQEGIRNSMGKLQGKSTASKLIDCETKLNVNF